jgi:hypothetical protein
MNLWSRISWFVRRTTFPMLALLAAVSVAGCHRDDVKVYHVVKDEDAAAPTPTPTPAPADMSAPAPANNSQPQLQFVLPPGWQQVAPSQMRVASFIVTNDAGAAADVGVIPLPAGGDDELALVNMWRDQMRLPALTNETTAETVPVAGATAKLYEIASTELLIDNKSRARILVAELNRGATSWFFKMTGEDSFVAAQKDSFLQFLKSLSFMDAPAAPTAPMASMEAPATQPPNPTVNSIWTVPADWQPLPASEFLFAKFLIQTGDARAEVNISQLGGTGGGLLPNANRWRGQLGLSPVSEADLPHLVTTINMPAGKLEILDFTGKDAKTSRPTRLIGIVAPQNGQTWFYKLMGDPTVVAAQKNTFLQFIRSAKYP